MPAVLCIFHNSSYAGGTQAVLSGLVTRFDVEPWAMLSAFPPMPLPADLRRTCLLALQIAVKVMSLTIHGALLLSWQVVGLTGVQKVPM